MSWWGVDEMNMPIEVSHDFHRLPALLVNVLCLFGRSAVAHLIGTECISLLYRALAMLYVPIRFTKLSKPVDMPQRHGQSPKAACGCNQFRDSHSGLGINLVFKSDKQ